MAALGAIFLCRQGDSNIFIKGERSEERVGREKRKEKERGVAAHEGDDGGQDAEGGKICAS